MKRTMKIFKKWSFKTGGSLPTLNKYFAQMKRVLLVFAITVAVFACKKSDSSEDDGINPEDKVKAAAMVQFLEGNKFMLKKYYSETPIDYIDTDQVVKAETDLWQYVSEWLHDDGYGFDGGGHVFIEQNAKKIPSEPTTLVLERHYAVKADKNGVGFDFVGHEYQELKYRLIVFNDTLLKVSATWNGKTVISEFNTIP